MNDLIDCLFIKDLEGPLDQITAQVAADHCHDLGLSVESLEFYLDEHPDDWKVRSALTVLYERAGNRIMSGYMNWSVSNQRYPDSASRRTIYHCWLWWPDADYENWKVPHCLLPRTLWNDLVQYWMVAEPNLRGNQFAVYPCQTRQLAEHALAVVLDEQRR